MSIRILRGGARALLGAGLLVSALVVSAAPPFAGGATRPLHPAPLAAPAPRALAASLKPDVHGADLANTGTIAATGPALTPTQVLTDQVGSSAYVAGIELAPDGSAIAADLNGVVAAFGPDGTQKWSFNAGSYALNTLGALGSYPVLSSDGAVYIGNEDGSLYQIDASSGAAQAIDSVSSQGGFMQTPKIGADNTLYLGDQAGRFYHLTPPALGSGSSATVDYTFAAGGSVQPPTSANPGPSSSPKFYGEAALDGSGNAYVASADLNSGGTCCVGTLYKVRPDGTEDPAFQPAGATASQGQPLAGYPLGAPVLAANPAHPGQTLVLVADSFPELAAFDAATGQQVWDFVPTPAQTANGQPSGLFYGTPAVANGHVYIANANNTLFGLDLATGQPLGGNFPAALINGSRGSPIVDAAGHIYIGAGSHVLNAYDGSGALLWSVTTAGTSGNYYVPAIAADGTIYAGSNAGRLTAYRSASPPSITRSPTSGTPFQSVVVSGTGFGANEPVKIYWDITTTTPLTTATTLANGSFVAHITAPQARLGMHTIIAMGQSSHASASTSFQVKPAIFLSPTSGRAGSRVTLTGVGFAAGETVAALWYPGLKQLNHANSNAVGTVTMTFTVPMSPTATYDVIGYGLTSRQPAFAPFKVTAQSLSPHVGAPSSGDKVTATWACATATCDSTATTGAQRAYRTVLAALLSTLRRGGQLPSTTS